MPIARIKDLDVSYEIDGAGPPLLLISGMGGMAGYWKPQVPVFSQHYKVITYDQRGTGKTTPSRVTYTVELLAQDVIDLLDFLGLDKVRICGHSTGGMIAQVLASVAPERIVSMVQYGTRAHADAFTHRAMGLRRRLLLDGKVEEFVRSTALFLYPSWWIVANSERLTAQEDLGIANFTEPEIMASRIDAVLHHDQVAALPATRVRTLVTCARDDFLTPQYYSEQLHGLISGSQLAFIEKGGHACSLTNPEPFNELVMSFFEGDA
ncbi:pyrimidine utilization protein D [soil metagenome]